MEIHLESSARSRCTFLRSDLRVHFGPGERIHTENSYKYRPGEVEALLQGAGFAPEATWTDRRGWFAVCLGRARE